jgi:glycosyltransferase involved in cell wall biosynthesis
MAYGGSLAGRRLQIPFVLEVNGDHLPEMEALGVAPKGIQRWLSVALMKGAISRTSAVVAAGDGWRTRFIDRWQIEPERITVVENGSEIVDLLAREDLRAFSTLSQNGEVTVAYVGGYEPWHGLPILIKAVAKAIREGTPVKLLLIGSGSTSDEIQNQVKTLGIADSVHFMGRLNPKEMAHHLAQADIGASPYFGRAEYSGLKLLDYKGAGLTTIASGADGQPAILEHGRTGWIVSPGDVDALAAAIHTLSREDELRRRIGREARLEAERCHRWHHTAQQLAEIFDQLIQPQTRASVKSYANCNASH